jgi:hypothetical protein
MTRHDKIEAVLSSLLLAFCVPSLMEEQRQQVARLRALRQRLQSADGLETDRNNLMLDSNRINADLRSASEKALSDVNQ